MVSAVTLEAPSAQPARPALQGRVRTRFAPSPTGDLHLGGLRTALFSWLLARKHGGQFVLRIEDTDAKRSAPGTVEGLVDTLRWAGLTPDEGPGSSSDGGGAYGPYVQSERTHLYRPAADRLLASGLAYPCFCSDAALQLERKRQLAGGLSPRYSGACRRLSAAERQERRARGDPHTVRLDLERALAAAPSPEHVVLTDAIMGRVATEPATQTDTVLLKSDGMPTYHLANVVDDHLMQITHVLRGQEWMLSTSVHLALYCALGWTPPRFAHLPLLLDPEGGKLSKRKRSATVDFYRHELGLSPTALLSFVAQLGWTSPQQQVGGDSAAAAAAAEEERLHAHGEVFLDMQEIVDAFSLEGITRKHVILNASKLEFMSSAHIRAMIDADGGEHGTGGSSGDPGLGDTLHTPLPATSPLAFSVHVLPRLRDAVAQHLRLRRGAYELGMACGQSDPSDPSTDLPLSVRRLLDDPLYIRRAAPLIAERCATLSIESIGEYGYLFAPPSVRPELFRMEKANRWATPLTPAILQRMAERLGTLLAGKPIAVGGGAGASADPSQFKQLISEVAKEFGVRQVEAMMPVRLVLTMQPKGPPVGDIMSLLGRARIEDAFQRARAAGLLLPSEPPVGSTGTSVVAEQ